MKDRKWYRNPNFLLIAVLLCAIAAVFAIALRQQPSSARNPSVSTGADADEPTAYVLCSLSASGTSELVPLPTAGSVTYPIRQTLADGTAAENILLLTPEGFCMGSATCANQDCVHQGQVTLDNRDIRLLQNSVICLPNQVMAELYTAGEIAQMELSEAEGGGDAR